MTDDVTEKKEAARPKSRLLLYIGLTFALAFMLYVLILAMSDFSPSRAEAALESARPKLMVWRLLVYAGIASIYWYVRSKHKRNGNTGAVSYLDRTRNYGFALVAIIELPNLLRLTGVTS